MNKKTLTLIPGRRKPAVKLTLLTLALGASLVQLPVAQAHGYAGKRLFPATMAVDDPAVGDEAGFVTSQRKAPNDDGDLNRTTTTDVEYARRLTPDLALSVGGIWKHIKPGDPDGSTANGFDNTEIGAKYRLYVDPQHEAMVSAGLGAELGGTGSTRVGAEPHTTLKPALYFGKGFGDLPQSARYLRPLAVTGFVAPGVTAGSMRTESVEWGLTLQYSLPYLQSFVKDAGLKAPFNRLIPVVEAPMETCTAGDCAGRTTGTINPGVLWVGKALQLGLEAAIPVNRASGSHTGVLLQVHFALDDLFPGSLGKPVWGHD